MKLVSIVVLMVIAFTASYSQENRRHTDRLFFTPSIQPGGSAGSGFFVTGPAGKLFGVTTAHQFANKEGITGVQWIDRTGKSVATFTATLGKPGKAGVDLPAFDYREDFMIFPFTEESEPNCLALSVKPAGSSFRNAWFPYRDDSIPNGWRKVDAEILGIDPGAIGISIPPSLDLKGRQGSPLLSVPGNQVVGILVGKKSLRSGKTAALFAPVGDLRFRLFSETQTFKLSSGVSRVDPPVAMDDPDSGEVYFPPEERWTSQIDNTTWQGVTPFGYDLTVAFKDGVMNWDALKDWSSEIKMSPKKNHIVTYWFDLRTNVDFTFDDDFRSCVVVVASNPKPVKLVRVTQP